MKKIEEHKLFAFTSLDELKNEVQELNLNIGFEQNIDNLLIPYKVGGFTLRNRLIIQPMEGADGLSDGSPSELTLRRYNRFASGGASIIWLEACAVVPEGRANPRQLWLTKKNLVNFQKMVEEIHKSAEQFDKNHKTKLILQLTHSGRYSKPEGKPKPIIAHHSKILDPVSGLKDDYPLITDDELRSLEDKYVETAILAEQAGFDGIDIKSCHRYLLSELLASFTRENSIYGGSFENRTRLLKNIALKIKDSTKSIFISTRINAYDSIEYPYGFGVNKEDLNKPDLTEIKEIIKFFKSIGSPFVNITIGNPYFNPHVNRPFDLPTIGGYIPKENPLFGVNRFFEVVKDIQQNSEIPIIGGGYTWLRHFFPYAAAHNIKNGFVSLVGLGRMGFAYPEFVKELYANKKLNPTKVCVSCSACTQIMRDGGRTGCVPRDGEIYGEMYKEGRSKNPQEIIKMAERCRDCVDPTCQSLCPANVNIPAFIKKIANADFEGAYEIIIQSNPFPEICSYVCPSEELCQKGCINQYYDESVKIRHLQQFVSEYARQNNYKTAVSKIQPEPKNKKIAVIGAGPSGLACARTLLLKGFEATIFDKSDYFGGVPLDLIPEERISTDTLQAELKYQLAENKLFHFRGNQTLSKEFNLDNIFAEGFDAIYVAIGLTENTKLPVKNTPKSGVEDAFSFLKRIKKNTDRIVPDDVVVIGGGNTAIDAAVTAKKSGAKDVYIIYRRTFNEIPAWPKERELAMNVGVNFLILTQPVDYITDNSGKLTGIKVVRTKLSPLIDKSGRRKPIEIPDTEHIIDCKLVIEAIGQRIGKDTLAGLNGVLVNSSGLIELGFNSYQTTRTKVFAGGDMTNGGDTVVMAIGDGVRAASEIENLFNK